MKKCGTLKREPFNNYYMIQYAIRISVLLSLLVFCTCGSDQQKEALHIPHLNITVDGNTGDWNSAPLFQMDSKDHLWIGEGLPEGRWTGKKDLSVSVRIAWSGQKLYFLFEVTDDTLSRFDREFTWENDCIEIHLDPENREGERIRGITEGDPLEARIGRENYGYEMHFLPAQPPKVFVDDTRGVFYTDSTQNRYFQRAWNGEVSARDTEDGYLVEIGFDPPGSDLSRDKIIGMDIGICDDDGMGRKSLMVWSRFNGPFWITMDHFKKLRLQ